MLAPLLFGLGISLTATWQAVSAIVEAQSLVLLVMAPFEWRKMTNRPILPRVKLQILFGCLINCALLLNAARKAQTSLPPKQADQLPAPSTARPT